MKSCLQIVLAAVLALTVTTDAFAGRKAYTFTLRPGASKTIPVPQVGGPLLMMGADTTDNGATGSPTEMFSALLSEDPNSFQLTWIGTSSDGSQNVGNTLGAVSNVIAFDSAMDSTITGSAGSAGAPATLTFTYNSGRGVNPIKYSVVFTY